MQHTDVLQRIRNLLTRPDEAVSDLTTLSGPTLIQQEPDLAKEASRRSIAVSGWSAGGQPTD